MSEALEQPSPIIYAGELVNSLVCQDRRVGPVMFTDESGIQQMTWQANSVFIPKGIDGSHPDCLAKIDKPVGTKRHISSCVGCLSCKLAQVDVGFRKGQFNV